MKSLVKLLLASAVIAGSMNIAFAQNSKKEQKQAAIKKMIADTNFVFLANMAYPMRGGSKSLTSEYDVRVKKDSLVSFLPYFGRSTMGPAPGSSESGGINLALTNFSYAVKETKKGNWDITIKPSAKDQNLTNWKDVQQLNFNISPDGYASLQVISSHRDNISFQGYIEVKNPK